MEGAKRNWKGEQMKRTYGEKGSDATWSRGSPRWVMQESPLEILPTQDKTQSRHLGYYPPEIRPK